MTQIEIRAYLEGMKSEFNAKIQAQTDMIDKVVLPKIDEIITHQKEANHRTTKLEEKEAARDVFCSKIQSAKDANDDRDKKELDRRAIMRQVIVNIITIIISISIVLFGTNILK